ncbi:exodeoxyribonuclease VII large subunit [Gracilibacillus halophilus YIM-C55.5]|uniref:Exodeoxyribonuclease 7 large subunit n=1 Tax=Gracilibacillus halophilus YIM-C55.5 TaxID=1308866 RepID=N4WDV6_9BACI|nr:exodeoxyribonuclease VII large subunit [Gracilibacillus halophilus]ENH97429.1 exodeoxyribonuclease VII large subunit [Gracilibacillus halophilus YIM-C55.5]
MKSKYLTVSALTKYIKKKFDVDHHLTHVWLKGEISNFKHHSRGHMYMTIKDDQANIRAVMFASHNRQLRFMPEDGMNVLLHGHVSVFEAQGQYQLYVKEMIPDGLGDLHLAYEQLKEKLTKEGLFLSERKQSLPEFPSRIGVLTSPTGAAIRDILTTLSRRFPLAKVLIIPVAVQGNNAAQTIVDGLQYANELKDVDLLIVGRGGGSMEELWSFNEEIVARAIAASNKPVISAVGHETDLTISDLVADARAPTPTAAAEIAVPSQSDLMERIKQFDQRLHYHQHQLVQRKKEAIKRLKQSQVFRFPRRFVEEKEQVLDRYIDQLNQGIQRNYRDKKLAYHFLLKRFEQQNPRRQMHQKQQLLLSNRQRLEQSIHVVMQMKNKQFQHKLTQLSLLDPIRIMQRGYSITYSEDGDILTNTTNVQPKDTVRVRMSNGILTCEVKTKEGEEDDGK